MIALGIAESREDVKRVLGVVDKDNTGVMLHSF
jgi:hypothetical protein